MRTQNSSRPDDGVPDTKIRKGEATREALMNAALELFAGKGYLRTHVADIVRLAGKSNGVFHIYFRNKEDLLDAWLAECDRTVPWHQADTSLLFEKASRFVLHGYWSLYERYGAVLDALEAASLVSDHFRTRLDDRRRKAEAGIARMIRHAQSEGRCHGIDPELTAISIGAVISKTTAYWFHNRTELAARGFDHDAALNNLEILYARMLEPARTTAGDRKAAGNAPSAQGERLEKKG